MPAKVPHKREAAAPTIAAEPTFPPLRIQGGAARSIDVVASSSLSVLCGVGQVDEDKTCLVPYLDFRLLTPAEDFSDETPRLAESFEATLTFENGAFMVMDLAREFRSVCHNVNRFSDGSLRPEPNRVGYIVDCMRKAQKALQETLGELSRMADASAADETGSSEGPPSPTPVARDGLQGAKRVPDGRKSASSVGATKLKRPR